ncbi:hypothetical protein [Pseudoalteromonas sp. T1lg10]|uniref:hypothetical protein n=1 Tax=Pseudoalteromonas sp. T1lg10 TaxID=2077093 RepID=UPI000CF63126|nr:hypothetical protein [Pseudoalteromonas sp. T1lg10]
MKKLIVTLVLLAAALLVCNYLRTAEPSSMSAKRQPVLNHSEPASKAPKIEEALAHASELKEQAVELDSPETAEPTPIRQPDYLPPIAQREAKTSGYQYQGDLDDHQAYLQFQHQQQADIKQAYIVAAKVKVEQLKELLARGEREGISEEQRQFARGKIAAIEKMSAELEEQLEAQTIAQ